MHDAWLITRGLVIRTRWLNEILSGRKTWEMRSRATTAVGPVALVEKGSGTVVGVARLTGCGTRLDAARMRATTDRHAIPTAEIPDAVERGWTVPWYLADARRLPMPVPYQHTNGAVVWVRLDDTARVALHAQLNGAV